MRGRRRCINRGDRQENEIELALNSNPYFRIYSSVVIEAIHHKEFKCAEAL
jgi:hypothetical protein